MYNRVKLVEIKSFFFILTIRVLLSQFNVVVYVCTYSVSQKSSPFPKTYCNTQFK